MVLCRVFGGYFFQVFLKSEMSLLWMVGPEQSLQHFFVGRDLATHLVFSITEHQMEMLSHGGDNDDPGGVGI